MEPLLNRKKSDHSKSLRTKESQEAKDPKEEASCQENTEEGSKGTSSQKTTAVKKPVAMKSAA